MPLEVLLGNGLLSRTIGDRASSKARHRDGFMSDGAPGNLSRKPG
jgi:hypothetical protein